MFAELGATTMGRIEIRIVLDGVEPPVGRLRVVHDPGQVYQPCAEQDVAFTGWLGLLRALYDAAAAPGTGASPEP